MALRTEHQIADLHRSPGELSFQARVGGETRTVWFRTESAVTPTADAALAACLMPAMRHGGALTMTEPVSPRVKRNQLEFQAIQAAWSRNWEFGDPPLEQVEVRAPVREAEPAPTGRVAAFFSGGVDSWSTILDNPDLTDLIFVRGIDILSRAEHQAGLADRVEARLREAAAQLGLDLHVVDTNLRELSDPLVRWEAFYGCAVVAVALFLEPLFDRVLIAGESDYDVQVKLGANWLVDQLWSTEGLEIVDDGGNFSRVERTRRVAAHPVAQQTLRVCWLNPGGAYNCGHCRKCLMTMITLEALGVREAVSTFPRQLDLGAIAAIEIKRPVTLTFWEDVLDAAREARRLDLERPLEALVSDAKRGLGLPPEYRRRRLPGPNPTPSARQALGPPAVDSSGSFFATPATAAAIAATPALAILIGSYDGSGNFGDIAQLDAGLDLLERLGEEILIAPVVERSLMASHDDLRPGLLHHIEHTLYFDPDPDAADADDGLVPVSAGAKLDFASCYLYGGGYLNAVWGGRKLAMLGAAERLFESADSPPVARISSGLQVDPEWVSELAPGDADALRNFDLLGSRDPRSHHALARLGSGAPLLEMGDDALGVLAGVPAEVARAEAGEALQINVNFGPHDWVTERADALLNFYVDFLHGLERRCGRPIRVLPLLTYVDFKIDERPALSRLGDACSERGIAFDEPIELRPASLDGAAPELRRAGLTLSCSYHAALASLMLGVPAALLDDTPYYSQKAAGLLSAFGLPAGFSPASDEDGSAAAERIAALLLDPEARADLEARIAGGGSMLRRRRAAAEVELLGKIATQAIAARDDAPRSTALLAAQRREGEARAELGRIVSSRSWRLAAPLRAAATRARALRDRAKPALGKKSGPR
jgi:polysaccharide pyruvyl transferase WcaK-like protein